LKSKGVDEQILSCMLRVAGETKDFGKALDIIAEMEEKDLLKETETYNSIISVYGKTIKYAELAI
jgi:pentatricopeptide repeat protein